MALSTTGKLVFVLALPILMIDLVIYILSLTWVSKLIGSITGGNDDKQKTPQSVPVGKATATHGCPRRSPKAAGKEGLYASQTTLCEAIQKAVEQFGGDDDNNKIAMVTRKFVALKKLKPTDKFPTKIYDDTQVEEISFKELGGLIRHFGIGLQSLQKNKNGGGLFGIGGGGGDSSPTMVIFEDTCKQWSISMHGALSQSVTVATCYATLGDDAVVAAVNETGASTLLLNWKHVGKYCALAAQKKMPTLQTIIASTYELPDDGTSPTAAAAAAGPVQVLSWDEVIGLGKLKAASGDYKPNPPSPDDTAVIMYTSGSTGKPKGVVMKHSQLMSGVEGMAQNVHLRPGQEVNVSYLPLAHVLALQVENTILARGGKVCYSDARSLAKALGMFKPTVFCAVPKVYEILRGALEKKLGRGMIKTVFDVAFVWKSFLASEGMDSPVTNVLFKAVASKVFGGVLQFAVSGGGALNSSLHNYCRTVFCCPIIQGYALTETCVGGCFQAQSDLRDGVVGPPVPCVEIMLQSEPDIKDSAGMPYLHTDTVGSKGEAVVGRGEICFRGPCISSGYYKMPDKTKEVYDSEGWFHSGDIGQFTTDGVIQIIDRKKNIVKLKGGEYVAVENMENAFSQSELVSVACVIANGDLDRAVVIVNTTNDMLTKWATDNGVSYDSPADLADKAEVKKAVLSSMKEHGKEAGLTSLENGVKDCVIITSTVWEAGNGFTASGKLDRAGIFKMHKKELNEMLVRNGAPAM